MSWHCFVVRVDHWQQRKRARKENWVTAQDAIVNKEMARERRWRAWFIRSFKGVMWWAVGNWLSLKEPSRDTERGDGKGVCVNVCLWVGRIPNTCTFFGSTCSYPNKFLAPVKHFISPLGKTTIITSHHINSCVPLPLKRVLFWSIVVRQLMWTMDHICHGTVL